MTTSNRKANIQCEIQKVWDTIAGARDYAKWQSDVSKTVAEDEKRFKISAKDGYETVFTVTAAKAPERLELDVENSHIKGHWILVLTSKGCETEIDFTASVTAKKLQTRPVGKGVFEKTYLEKEQTRLIADLKRALE